MRNEFVTVRGEKYYVKDDTLDLSRKEITDITEIEGLDNLTNLQSLWLTGNQIKEIKGLENLTNLQMLNLNYNQIKEIRGLAHFKALQYLDLSGNQIEEIKGLEHLFNLQQLDLRANPIKTDEKYSASLFLSTKAQELVQYCQEKLGMKLVIVKGTEYPVIDDKLDLSGMEITDINEIKGLGDLKNLQILNLNYNQIKEIKGLEHLKTLRYLDLSGNQIEEIKGLEHLFNLQQLDLRANPIKTDEKYSASLFLSTNAQEIVRYCKEKKENKVENASQETVKHEVTKEDKDDKIFELLERYKDDLIMLDALYQWVSNPTSRAANKKCLPPNHGLIKKNIEGRYNLDSKKVEYIYNTLVKEIENLGIDFATGYNDFAYNEEIMKRINEECGVLREGVLQRLNSASQEEKYIVWLYLKTKDYSYFFPHNRHSSDTRNFITLFNLTFDFTPKSAIDPLIRIGFINRLEWIHSKCERSSEGYYFPNYLESLASEIDEYIDRNIFPTELPDFKKYIDAIFDRRIFDALVCLDELLNLGYASDLNLIHGKIMPSPSIIEKIGHSVAINPRIYESFKNYFFERKANEVKMSDKIKDTLTQLYNKHYPMLTRPEKQESEQFKASKLWLIDSYNKSLAESEILVVLAPWLIGNELKWLKDNYSEKFVVIITTLMGLPDINMLYKEIFNNPINESALNWMILDFSKDKVYEMVVNEKPLLFDELKKIIVKGDEDVSLIKRQQKIVETITSLESIYGHTIPVYELSKRVSLELDVLYEDLVDLLHMGQVKGRIDSKGTEDRKDDFLILTPQTALPTASQTAQIDDDESDVFSKSLVCEKTEEGVVVKRGFVPHKDTIMFGFRVENRTQFVVLDVKVTLDYPKDILELVRAEGPRVEGSLVYLQTIRPGEARTAIYYLSPIVCTASKVGAELSYRDYQDRKTIQKIPWKVIEACRFVKPKSMSQDDFRKEREKSAIKTSSVVIDNVGDLNSLIQEIRKICGLELVNATTDTAQFSGESLKHEFFGLEIKKIGNKAELIALSPAEKLIVGILSDLANKLSRVELKIEDHDAVVRGILIQIQGDLERSLDEAQAVNAQLNNVRIEIQSYYNKIDELNEEKKKLISAKDYQGLTAIREQIEKLEQTLIEKHTNLEKAIGEMDRKLGEIAKTIPLPSRIEMAPGKVRDTLRLVFTCSCNGEQIGIIEDSAWKKWVKVLAYGLKAGVNILLGDYGDAVKDLKKALGRYGNKEALPDQTFLLTQEEKDELIKKLRESEILPNIQYCPPCMGWVCLQCWDETNKCCVKHIQDYEEKRKMDLEKPKDVPIEVSVPPILQLHKVLTIKRGYETAGQYVKVGIKVENISPMSITDVKVILDPPSGLEPVNPKSGIIEIGVIRPQGSQGANFQLKPIRCVNDVIHATIIYRDAAGKAITEDMEALKVRNICPMLTDEGVDKEHILMSLRKGDIRKNTSSFKFRGDLKTAFIMAEARVRGLIQLDRDERFINDHYIASGCYIGRTKYGKFDFATEITVCGKENEGLLTIAVYSGEKAILSGFFYEVLEDVRKSVEIIEEKVKVVDEACPECGGKFGRDKADTEGFIRCDLCETLLRLPSWKRGN